MGSLYSVLGWGSPLGIGLFLFFMAAGAGVFLWGLSHVQKNSE